MSDGVLEQPLWLLLPLGGDWHWTVRGRADSPWYPTARLFRQDRAGDWSSVVGRLVQALSIHLAERR